MLNANALNKSDFFFIVTTLSLRKVEYNEGSPYIGKHCGIRYAKGR